MGDWRSVIFSTSNPELPIIGGLVFLFLYLSLTLVFYSENAKEHPDPFWRRRGLFDNLTSALLVVLTGWLIFKALQLGAHGGLSFGYLAVYYFLFIGLFGCIFSLIEWHAPGSLEGVSQASLNTEIACFILSFQTITTLGPTRATPRRYAAEIAACLEAVLGIVFIGVFVAQWVNAQSATLPKP